MLVTEYGKVHSSVCRQVEAHVEMFWYGGIQRRIDCCKTLYIPTLSDVRCAVDQLVRAEAEAQPRRLRTIFEEVREELYEVIRFAKAEKALNYILNFEELYHYVSRQASDAHIAYGHRWLDGRKRKACGATWDAWKQCLRILDGVNSLEIPEQEMIDLRLQPIREGRGTLLDAFLIWLHHGKDFGFALDFSVHSIIDRLQEKQGTATSVIADVRLFVRTVWHRELNSVPDMQRLKIALDDFLPSVQYADEELALKKAENEDYNKVFVSAVKETLAHLWGSPVRIMGELPEVQPCSTVLLAYN